MRNSKTIFFIFCVVALLTISANSRATGEVGITGEQLEVSSNEVIAWLGGVFGTFIAALMLSLRQHIVSLVFNKQKELERKIENDKHNKKLLYTDMFFDFLATAIISAEKSKFNNIKDKAEANRLKKEYVENKVKNELPSYIADGLIENSLSSEKLLKENLHTMVKKVKSGRFHLGTFLKDIGKSYIKSKIVKH